MPPGPLPDLIPTLASPLCLFPLTPPAPPPRLVVAVVLLLPSPSKKAMMLAMMAGSSVPGEVPMGGSEGGRSAGVGGVCVCGMP